MNPGQHRTSREELNEELAQMARCLTELGPEVNQVAKALGRFKETVRYRYHHFFRERGIGIQAAPNYPRLGFKRLVLVVSLAPSCEPNATSIFNTLSDLCYLHSFTRVLLTGQYIVHVAVPAELQERCVGVYRSLFEAGLFSGLEVLSFDEMRNPPMRTESFDFVRGEWRFDWDTARDLEMKLPLRASSRVEKYDKTDLLILKELDKNAACTLARMAETLDANVSALEFHYREHVKERGLVRGYRLVWQGTRADLREREASSRKDLYIEVTLLLKDATQAEMAELMLLLNKTPFLWSEAHGSAYCAELFIPHQEFGRFLEYIDPFAKRAKGLRVFTMDQSHAVRFVIAYSLFDGVSKKWSLDEQAVMKSLGGLAVRP